MKKLLGVFCSAVMAGLCIGLGGTVYLQVKDTFPGGAVVGALLFAIGLFAICTRGYHLFTGRVCSVLEQPPAYLLELTVIWVGNLAGSCLLAGILRLTRVSSISTAATALVEAKMADGYLSLFLLGLVCNVLIYLAVNGYARNPHELGKYLALFLGVSVFILSGTEHSVADMYYWAVSGMLWQRPLASLARLAVITLGNAVGGVLLPLLEKAKNNLSGAAK